MIKETDIFNYKTPEFYINMKSIPDKTSQERKSFVLEEKRKCREGININGLFIPGSLYFHLNYYYLQGDDEKTGKKAVFLPRLRDNEWIFFNDYEEAYKNRQIYTFFGLRQAGKSEMEVSLCLRELSLFKETEAIALFSRSNDKDTFVKKISTAINYGEKFIIVPNIDKDWKKEEIRFGIMRQDSSVDLRSRLFIYNTQEGKKIQAGSGKTPSFMLMDEIAISPFRSVYDVLEPALLTDYGSLRCSPIFTFTGGEAEKAKDAEDFVKNPTNKQFQTVLENGQVVGGRFLNGLYRKDCKVETTLSKYLNKKTNSWIDDFPIYISDTKLAEKKINEEKEEASKSSSKDSLLLKRIFFPLDLNDVFLTPSNNNFPIQEITLWQEWVKENYDPKIVEFYTDVEGKLKYKSSNKGIITEFPVKPTSHKEAGVVIYEDFIEGLPFGTYVGGLDLYNQNESSDRVNSLGSYHILKRMYDPLGEFQYCIVASYSARPQLKEFKETVVKMMKYYNAYTLVEHTNTEAIDWFIERGLGHYLAEGLGIAKEVNPFLNSGYNIKGTKPTPGIQKHYMNLEVEYTKEQLMTKITETGIEKEILGLTRIYDIMLLEEMKNYKSKESTSKGVHDGNFDRIISFGHALMLARHLDKVQPLTNFKYEQDNKDPLDHNVVLKGVYNLQKKNPVLGKGNSILNRPFIMK